MARLIDAEALTFNFCETEICDHGGKCQECPVAIVTREQVDNAPTVEGRPIAKRIQTNYYGEHKNLQVMCSRCKTLTLSINCNFCPSCGAKMEGTI